MSTIGRVTLRELDGVAELVGEPNRSEVISSGGKQMLRGTFAVRLNGVQTSFTDLSGARAEVTPEGNDFALQSMARSVFVFDPILTIQPGAHDPWLAASRLSLALAATANAPVLLSLDDASLSLVPDVAPAPGQRFHFPTMNGTQSTAITPISAAGIFGTFVRPLDGGGFGVRFGGLGASVDVDHHRVTSLVIPRDTSIVLRIGSPPPSLRAAVEDDIAPQALMLRGDRSIFGMNVVLHDSTEGRLQQSAPGGKTFARCSTVEIGEGWLSVTEMHDSQKDVAVARLHAVAAGDETKLVGRPTRVRFHMPLARQDGAPIHADAPHFAYRDPGVETETATAPRERHHGLRIRGLHSVRGGQAKLDANWATASVIAGKLQFQAGGDINVRGRQQRSVVVPKADPDDPTRRTLVIPAGVAELSCAAPRIPGREESPIRFDTSLQEDERLRMKVVLNVPPSGTPGVADAATARAMNRDEATPAYARWELVPRGEPMMKLRVNDRGVFPASGEGWPNDFAGGSASFALVEHPGSHLILNPGTPDVRALAAGTTTTSVTTIQSHTTGKELLVYSALGAVLVLREKIFEYFLEVYAANIEDAAVRVEIADLRDETVFKSREVDSLLAVFCDEHPDDQQPGPGDRGIQSFVEANLPLGKTRLVWAFAPGLAVLMWDQHDHPDRPWCFQIARDRGAQRPGMAIDQSSIRTMEFADFGWDAADRLRFAAEPLLWPRLSRRSGAQLDPSESAWRGVVLRDLPLVLAIDPNVVNNSAPPFVKRFYEGLNQRLMLDYGWKDETGTTWRGGFEDLTGLSLAPDGWKRFLDIQLLRFMTRGSAGRILGADGEFRVLLPRIVSRDGAQRPLSFTGKFALNIANGVELEQIEFAPEDPEDFSTPSIPGFEKVEIVRFSSDLKTMRLTLRLTPSDALASVLPFLGGGQALDVTSLVPLQGEGAAAWSFTLRSEIQTNLFGRFPTTIQSVRLTFQESAGHSANILVLQARVHLGQASFASVGADLILTEQPDGSWKIDVRLQEISGSIDIGDFHLRGTLAWSNENGDAGEVSSTQLATAAQRDFWGEITLDTGGLVDGTLLLRIGNAGELSYWVGALRLSEIGFGPAATLKKPAILVAHHADFDGHLKTLITDVQTSIAEAVRPPDTGVSRAWLARWKPSSTIGTVVAGSGFLNIHDTVASAPQGDNSGDFTCLVVTDGGLFRAEATVMLFQAARARIGLAVDLPNKRFSAGIQLPEFKYAAFTVRAGYIAFGLGWGAPYFLLSVGWPEPINGDVMNRDWSKSVMVRWDGAFPLNTFMGGARAELLPGALLFGLALRAGWTAEYSVGGEVAGGEASLGVMIGGIVEIYFGVDEAPRLRAPTAPRPLLAAVGEARALVSAVAERSAMWEDDDGLLAVLEFAVPHIEAILPALSDLNVTARVAFYGDIWGRASVHLFGVTLASIDVGAHAAFVGCVRFAPDLEIVRLTARVSLHLTVRIGCVEMSARADIDVTIRDLGGPCFPSESRAPRALVAEARKALA